MANVFGVKKRNGDLVHIDNDDIMVFDFPIDTKELLKTLNEMKGTPYQDCRMNTQLDEWLIYRDPKSKYISQLKSLFNLPSFPRFWKQEPGFYLEPHTDLNPAAINFVLTEDPAPINIEGHEYNYKAAVVNILKYHSVQNNDNTRVLFRLTIEEPCTFEETKNRVKEVLDSGMHEYLQFQVRKKAED